MNDLLAIAVAPDLKLHPLADIFPMLAPDELQDLASDIKANGLQMAIVLDAAGKLLVDGRNRLAACKIAKIEPRFERLNEGEDVAAFIVSANLQRRNMSQGQRAMALATIYPEAAKGGRGKLSRNQDGLGDKTTRNLVSMARTVLSLGPDDLAPAVLSGAQKLDDAYTEAQRRHNAASSDHVKFAQLQAEAPDLAGLVTEERMTLAEAIAALQQRKVIIKEIIDGGRRAAGRLLDFCGHVVSVAGAAEYGERRLVDVDTLKQLDDAMTLLRRIYEEGRA